MRPRRQKAPIAPRPRSRWTAPFLWFEWAMEWTVYWFSGLAIFQILEYIGKLSVVFGVILYIAEAPERRERSLADAWQFVNAANASDGTAGRYRSLQYLARNGASLNRLRINAADLSGIDFSGTSLQGTWLNRTVLRGANLVNVDFTDANLQNVVFAGANLNGAKLAGANLLCADFRAARNIAIDQVKEGSRWEIAVYDEEFRLRLGLRTRLEETPRIGEPGKTYYCPFP